MACKFCDVSVENGFSVVYEDQYLIAFTDISPAARLHIQVTPKRHIESVRSLTKNDVTFLKSMQKVGHKLLDDHNIKPSMRKMGFHIPPFNSVNHLHLHVIATPYSPAFKTFAFPISNGRGSNHKGLSWFVEVGQAIQILEDGRQIGVLPC